MRHLPPLILSLFLVACGGGGNGHTGGATAPEPPVTATRGALIGSAVNVPLTVNGTAQAKVEPSVFEAYLDGLQGGTTQITGKPKCALSIYRIKYQTVGAANETTDGTAAVMVPSGTAPQCSGPRPVLLYAHGTSVEKAFDMAALNTWNEARVVAAMFAAQGYLVVAPNYTGYGGSALAYHPYLVADAQANDMVDALRAARTVFAPVGASASTKLFVSGYSQGGHVAVATERAMQQNYASEFKVTALAGMSGPYALEWMGDRIFGGAPTFGISYFLPLLTSGAQHAGAKVYDVSASEIYEDPYANGIDALLPGTRTLSELYGSGKLPVQTLFAADSQPQAAGYGQFFGTGNLVRSAYRTSYLADLQANPCDTSLTQPLTCSPGNALRKFTRANDLRTFVPTVPTLLCGGENDPTVPYENTNRLASYFRNNTMDGTLLTQVNIDDHPALNDPYRNPKLAFLAAKEALRIQAQQAGQLADQAVQQNYHAGLVPPFCIMVVRDYFDSK